MRRITLSEFAAEKGQVTAAKLIGMRQSSLSKALSVERTEYVTEHDDGTFTAEEVRPYTSQQSKTEAA